MQQLLDFTGIDADRLRCRWVSSAGAPELVHEMKDFIDALRALGPSLLRKQKPAEQAVWKDSARLSAT